jgi:uncharacterized membrane protein YeiH
MINRIKRLRERHNLMRTASFGSSGLLAVLTASVFSSALGFVITVVLSAMHRTGNSSWADNLPAIIAIVFIWAPAFVLIPAGVLGLLVERPKARAAIKRQAGGSFSYIFLSVLAAALLSFLLRIVLHLANPIYPLADVFSLALFSLIGLCSGISWWFLVVLPGRRA